MNATNSQIDVLAADLSLVLGDAPLQASVKPGAFHHGKPVAWEEAIRQSLQLLATSRRSAFVGLNTLTIESLRCVVALARRHRSCLLPRPQFDSPLRLTQPVAQLGTQGHLMACDMIVGLGVKRTSLPARLQHATRHFEALPDSMATILELRSSLKKKDADHPFARLLRSYKSIGVVMAHTVDPVVASQWHQLAASMQQEVRLAILHLPAPQALNARGVEAVITWQTGVSSATGGVDFHSGVATPVPFWPAMLHPCGFDVIVDTGLQPLDAQEITASTGHTPAMIRIGSAMSPDAQWSFVVPDLAIHTRARVMRCDGQILWLCDDPATAQPDLTQLLLQSWIDGHTEDQS